MDADTAPFGLRATRVMADPGPRPDFEFDDARGGTFAFRERTSGHLTLLFFGYTNCPDVCPVHMSNIAEVKRDLGIDIARDLRVVFVTVDPERDTPERLVDWLRGFDREFIGLTGDKARVDSVQVALGLPPAVVPDPGEAGYDVGHASAVVAFTAGDELRVDFPFGTRQVDLRHDLAILADVGREAPAP